MGFLNFLKKKKDVPVAAPSDSAFPPPPGADTPSDVPPMPDAPPSSDMNMNEIEQKIGVDTPANIPPPPGVDAPSDMPADLPPSSTDVHPDNPVPTASMMANPLKSEDADAEVYNDDGDFESVPVPPPSMQDPDFLTSAADDFSPASAAKKEETLAMSEPPASESPVPEQPPAPEPTLQMPEPEPVPSIPEPEEFQKPAPSPKVEIELPDFTDEDIASAEKTSDMPEEQAEPDAQFGTPEQPDEVKPWIDSPAFGHIKAAMFLSSDAYFALSTDVKEVRKVLRDNDEVLKDAALQHEKGDDQLQRLAIEMNAIQERFMKLDSALFEE